MRFIRGWNYQLTFCLHFDAPLVRVPQSYPLLPTTRMDTITPVP